MGLGRRRGRRRRSGRENEERKNKKNKKRKGINLTCSLLRHFSCSRTPQPTDERAVRFLQSRGIKNMTRRITALADGILDCKWIGGASLARPPSRSITASCRAVLLPPFGGPEVLELPDKVEVPDLRQNEVLFPSETVLDVISTVCGCCEFCLQRPVAQYLNHSYL